MLDRTKDVADTGVAADELLQFIERIERVEGDRKALGDDLADIYKELASRGFDKKAVRQIVRMRAQPADERHEHEALVDLYKSAIGLA